MIRFVVVTMAGVAHEFSADAVDPGGDSLKFFEGEVEKKCFLKSEVLCWDSDVRGHLKLGSWGLPETVVGD